MRVLITTTGSAGHFGPLIPFAEALRAAGDDVIVATRESSADGVRAAGYEVWPFADAPAEQRTAVFRAVRDLPSDEANVRAVTEVFGGIDVRAALPGVLDACAVWRPHVVLAEVAEFAGGLAGAHLGVPVVTAGISLASTEHKVSGLIERALQEVRAEHALDAGAAPAAHVTLAPPLLEDPAAPGPENVRRFREHDTVPQPLPDWWDGAHDPLVYVTFGSIAPQQDYFPGLYRAAIDALAPLPVRLLVTVGDRFRLPGESLVPRARLRRRYMAELGPLPANVHVERWVPQADVVPHAAAMLCHGGFGTVRGGLAAGVPLVVLPLFADQPYNAQRVAELGAGIALERGPAAIAGAPEAVRRVLADGGYAERARTVAADVRALPTVDAAAELLRDLAAQRGRGATVAG